MIRLFPKALLVTGLVVGLVFTAAAKPDKQDCAGSGQTEVGITLVVLGQWPYAKGEAPPDVGGTDRLLRLRVQNTTRGIVSVAANLNGFVSPATFLVHRKAGTNQWVSFQPGRYPELGKPPEAVTNKNQSAWLLLAPRDAIEFEIMGFYGHGEDFAVSVFARAGTDGEIREVRSAPFQQPRWEGP